MPRNLRIAGTDTDSGTEWTVEDETGTEIGKYPSKGEAVRAAKDSADDDVELTITDPSGKTEKQSHKKER